MKNKISNKSEANQSANAEPNQSIKRMIGVMLTDEYVEKLKGILLHHKRTCRGQIMAWIDEETRIIALGSR